MNRFLGIGVSLAVVLGLVTAASAGQIVYTVTVPLSSTNWSTGLVIPQYGGPPTLTGIQIVLNGHVEGLAQFENQDGVGTVTMDMQALMKLTRPDCSTLVQVIPLAHTSDCVTTYDGVFDYAGTSGKTYSGLSADASDCITLTSPADLALFTGSGNIILPLTATGTSSGSGTGNLVLRFSTQAAASATITYYTVPEPATMTLLGSGLFGAAAFFRRHRLS